jgi:uncharacterized damage-inducible protein DinB
MRPIEQIIDRLNDIFDGEGTFGTTLRRALDGVSEEQARKRPIEGAHSIFEIVAHIATWTDVVAWRLRGQPIVSSTVEDWGDVTAQSWLAAIEDLEKAQSRLLDAVVRLAPEALEEKAAGKDYTNRIALDMIMNHIVYHTGQIALLRKLG